MEPSVSTIPPAERDVYAVILAGGSGTRFWPKSRLATPKQLCNIGGGDLTMLERTLARLDGFVPPERRLIVTHEAQLEATRRIAGARCPMVLGEPEARNTANALALATLQVEAMHGSRSRPIMISLHADHVIRHEDRFISVLADAVAVARQGHLTLVGIVPEYAETGYGYIERGAALTGAGLPPGAQAVASFREKPAKADAEAYLATGRFLWNAGYFVWRTDVILEELRERLPKSVSSLEAIPHAGPRGYVDAPRAALAAAYATLPKIAIDNAVMEVSRRVAVIPADIGWQDVGSWDALSRCFPVDAKGNLAAGDALLLDTKRTTVDTDGPFVATIGVEDLVVVAAHGAVLVCSKDKAQDVKKVVEWLTAQGRKELT
jgi:mannose-1-phosphate guanylyltransferase